MATSHRHSMMIRLTDCVELAALGVASSTTKLLPNGRTA
jgi:hypothetical protein